MKSLFFRIRNFISRRIYGAERWSDLQFQEACKRVQTIGPSAIERFSIISEDMGIKYSLMYGTLLGSYREKGFIKHDNDIDIGVERSCMTKELIFRMVREGFSFEEAFLSEDGKWLHLAFLFQGLKFDLYSFIIDAVRQTATSCVPRSIDGDWRKSRKQKKARVLNMTFPYKGFKSIVFEGISVKVWSNEDEILRINYGEDYLTPIVKAKAKQNSNIVIFPIEEHYFNILSKKEVFTKL